MKITAIKIQFDDSQELVDLSSIDQVDKYKLALQYFAEINLDLAYRYLELLRKGEENAQAINKVLKQ